MRSKQPRVQPNATDPARDEAGVLPRGHALPRAMSPDEQEFARLLAGGTNVVINRLPGLLGHLESNRLTGLLLPDRRPIEGVSAGATSSTLRATTSQPRNLLSIARLNMAKSRVCPST